MAANMLFAAVWVCTLIGGLCVAGGLGSLTNQYGIGFSAAGDNLFKLVWWYWCLEVFTLLWAAAGAFTGRFHSMKFAFVAMAGYVNYALTPVINTLITLPNESNILATLAGALIVVICNFILILLTAFFANPEPPTQMGTPIGADAKV